MRGQTFSIYTLLVLFAGPASAQIIYTAPPGASTANFHYETTVSNGMSSSTAFGNTDPATGFVTQPETTSEPQVFAVLSSSGAYDGSAITGTVSFASNLSTVSETDGSAAGSFYLADEFNFEVSDSSSYSLTFTANPGNNEYANAILSTFGTSVVHANFSASGSTTVVLIPGVDYHLQVSSGTSATVGDPANVTYSFSLQAISAPEPSTLSLVVVGMALIIGAELRHRKIERS